MSSSPNSKLVERTIDLNYMNKKRSDSIKWIIVNAVFLLLFVYDLSHKCPGYTTVLHYVELICAVMMAANLLQYAVCLLPSRATKLPLSLDQQKLLGLSDADLDSSFILNKSNSSPSAAQDSEERWSVSGAELSLSPRTWRSSPSPAASPSPAPSPPRSPPRATHLDTSQDQFIADHTSLDEYLRRWSEQAASEQSVSPVLGRAAPAPPLYQLAAPETAEEGGAEGAGGGAGAAAERAGLVWRRLHLDPQRLTQWNLNLRLWLHVTILSRLVREVEAADEALARLALCEAGALREGRVPAARLRAAPAARQLLPFLEPFPDQRYVVRRVAELAAGGCLSAYRWDGGGAGWDASRPTDAALLLHLFATYVGVQAGAGGAAAARVVQERTAPRTPDTLAIMQVSTRPPHYALAWGEETLEAGRGRNNLLHTLLLLLAAAARASPPALARLHLGPAGLNMLWIIGR